MIEHNPLTPTEFPRQAGTSPLKLVEGKITPVPVSTSGLMGGAPKLIPLPKKQHYVVGFLLYKAPPDYTLGSFADIDREKVLLIEKRTGPKWMKGLLNGLGGKVEPGEIAPDAMRREFREEAGVDVANWVFFTSLGGPDWDMDCFYARATYLQWHDSRTTTEEPLVRMSVRQLLFDPEVKPVPNVPFMVTMALRFQKDAYGPYSIKVAESHITGRKFDGSPTAETMAA